MTDQEFQNQYNATYWKHLDPTVLSFCGVTFNPNDGTASITNPQPPNTIEDQPARFQAAKELEAKGYLIDFQIQVLLSPPLWTMWQRTMDGVPYALSFGSGVNPTGQPVPPPFYPPGVIPTAPVDLDDYDGSLSKLAALYPPYIAPPPPPPVINPVGARQPWTAKETSPHVLTPMPAAQGGLPVYACDPSGWIFDDGQDYVDPSDGTTYLKVIWYIAGIFARTVHLWLRVN